MEKSKSKYYISLKKVGYFYCLLENKSIQKNDSEIIREYKDKLDNMLEVLNPKDAEILKNTLKFPFDFELYQAISNEKMTDENLLAIANKFGIELELLTKKIKEYVEYSYSDLIQSNTMPEFTSAVNMLSNEWRLVQKIKEETLENHSKK